MTDKSRIICESIMPLIKGLQKYPDDSCFSYGVSKLIRRFTEYPKDIGIPYMYSMKALEAAEKIGVDSEKLKWCGYGKQTQKSGLQDKGHSNGIFHHEHIIPISQTIKELIKLDDLSIEKIYEVLVNNYKIAWILKTEQKILDSKNKTTMRTPQILNDLDIYIKGFNC